jgi:hypothetical protein
MDRFSAISLFDFFSFLVPGFILQVAIAFCWQLSGLNIPFDFSLLSGNEALLFVFVSIAAYLLGHAIHFASTQFSWLGALFLPKKINGYSLLKQEKFLSDSLSKKAVERFGFSFLDKEGNVLHEECDRFFEISFRILENNGLLQTSRNLQVQFILFVNVYTVLAASAVLGLITILIVVFKPADTSSIKYLFIFSLFAGLLANGFLKIAAQRRKLFLKTIWWQFYSFYFHPPLTKNE